MTLLDEMVNASRHLKEADKKAEDWRIKDCLTIATTAIGAAIITQRKILLTGLGPVRVRPASAVSQHD